MKRLEYILFRTLNALIGIIPFRLLYVFSDILSLLVQYVLRYRRGTVDRNLRLSFPEISEDEIKRITRLFYKNLTDVALESIKGYSLSSEQLRLRYRCLNPEIANNYFMKRQSVIFALSHYANWEWCTQVADTIFMHNTISFYKPLSNKYIDKFLLKQRAMRGMELYSIYQTKFIFRAEDMMPKAFFFVSDQNPTNTKKAYWLKFLNQDTLCDRGLENYARLFNIPVIYTDVQRVERGRYVVILEVLTDKSKVTYPKEITEQYFKKMEEVIVKKPEDWLWSHRRCKLNIPTY